MIRFRLKELIADYEFRTQKRLTLDDVSKATKIHRTTLSKIGRKQGYNTTTENLDRLCEFFGCKIEMLTEYVPNPRGLPESEKRRTPEKRPSGKKT